MPEEKKERSPLNYDQCSGPKLAKSTPEPMLEPSHKNNAEDYYKDQSKIFQQSRNHGPLPALEGNALDAIQARAVGGKVAVIERGAKEATVIEAGETKKESKRHNEIPLSDSEFEILQELQSEINSIDLNIGQNTRLYTSMIKKFTEQADSASETLKSQVRRILKKHKAPEGWVVDLSKKKIVPSQQPVVMTRPSGVSHAKNK